MQLIPPSYNSFVNNDYTRFAIYLEMCRATATQRTKIKLRSESTTNGYENYNYFLWLIDGCRSVNKLYVYGIALPHVSSIYLSWLNYAMDTLHTFKIYKSVVYVSWVDVSKGGHLYALFKDYFKWNF